MILIQTIGEDWFSANTLREVIGLSSKSSFIRNYIKPAIEHGLLTLENQDKPNAPNQRYGLTVKGKALYYEHRDSIQNDPQIVQADPQNGSQNDPQKDVVVGAIKNNNRISRAELAAIAECSESTIKRRLKEWNIAWLGHPKTGHWVLIKDIQQRILKGIFNINDCCRSDYYGYLCVVDIRRTLKFPGVQKGNIHDFQES